MHFSATQFTASTLAALLVPTSFAIDPFYGTCSTRPGITKVIGNHMMVSLCQNATNQGVRTYLDLGLCFENYFGTLTAQNSGNYQNSCRNCTLSGDVHSLECTCDDGIRGANETSIDMGNTVGNDNGLLTCYGIVQGQLGYIVPEERGYHEQLG